MRIAAFVLAASVVLAWSLGSCAKDGKAISDEDVLRAGGAGWLLPLSNCVADIFSERRLVSEVSTKLCEDELDHCLIECRKGNEGLCFSAAYEHEKNDNEPYAHALFQRSCELGVTTACTNLAAHHRSHGSSTDKCVANAFFKACERDDEWGCAMSSVVVLQEEGVEQDRARALEYAEKACRLDADHDACALARQVIADLNQP